MLFFTYLNRISMVQIIFMQQLAYPNEKVLQWAVTSQEVKQCIDKGDTPQIVLPSIVRKQEQPVIAIILAQDFHPDREEKDYTVFPDYVDAVVMQGAYPVFVAYDKVEEQLEAIKPDGILLLGGNFRLVKALNTDYEPRPKAYVTMIRYAQKRRLPLFAVCGGEQMLAVYFGASVQLNINDVSEKYSGHMQRPYRISHQVNLAEGSQISKILEKNTINVNSCHKTAVVVDKDGGELVASGVAPDGVVEVVELKNPWNKDFVIGAQWHPERLTRMGDADSLKLFGAFIKSAQAMQKEECT